MHNIAFLTAFKIEFRIRAGEAPGSIFHTLNFIKNDHITHHEQE